MIDFTYDPRFQRFSDFLGLDKYVRDDFELSKKVVYLYDWGAKNTKGEDFVDLLKAVTKLKHTLGTTVRGKTLVNDMYHWVRLNEDGKRAKEEVRLKNLELSVADQEKLDTIERGKQVVRKWSRDKTDLVRQKEQVDKQTDAEYQNIQKQKASENKANKEANLSVDVKKTDVFGPIRLKI